MGNMFSYKRMYYRDNTTSILHKYPHNCSFPRCLSQISRGLTNHLQPPYGMNRTIACFCMINNDDDDDNDNNNNNNNIHLGFRSNKTYFSRLWRYLRHFHRCLGLPKSRGSLGWYWKANTGRLCCSILATFFFHLLGALEKLRKETISVVMSLSVEQLGCHWWIFMKFEI